MKKFNFLFILTLFITLFSTTCFASTYEYPVNATAVKPYSEMLIYRNPGDNNVYCVVSTVWNGTSTPNWSGFLTNGDTGSISAVVYTKTYFFVFRLDGDTWVNIGSELSDPKDTATGGRYNLTNNSTFLQTNTVVKDSTTNEIVFDSNSNVGTEEPENPPVEDTPENVPSLSYPTPPTMDYAFTYPVVYVAENGDVSLALFGSDSSINFDAIREEDKITVNFTTSSASKLSMYVLEDDEWDSRGHNVFSEAGTYTATLNMTSLLSSPFAIYNSDGTIFFHLPLESMGATITGAMWATTIVAVCCLALLIFLVVLSKVLRRYLA